MERALCPAFALPVTLTEPLLRVLLPALPGDVTRLSISLARILNGSDAQRLLWLFECYSTDGHIDRDAMSQLVLAHVAARAPAAGVPPDAALPLLELVERAFDASRPKRTMMPSMPPSAARRADQTPSSPTLTTTT